MMPPLVSTIHEYAPLVNAENVTDHTDTALYWIGAAASLGGIKSLASRKVKKEKNPEVSVSY
jgi:hypothetical protein